MHSTELCIHLQGETPKVAIPFYKNFFTVNVTFDKSTIKFFIDTEQELVNFKNNFLWAFEKQTSR